MLCPECLKHMEYHSEDREYYCPHCNVYIDENQLYFAPNREELYEDSDNDV